MFVEVGSRTRESPVKEPVTVNPFVSVSNMLKMMSAWAAAKLNDESMMRQSSPSGRNACCAREPVEVLHATWM